MLLSYYGDISIAGYMDNRLGCYSVISIQVSTVIGLFSYPVLLFYDC